MGRLAVFSFVLGWLMLADLPAHAQPAAAPDQSRQGATPEADAGQPRGPVFEIKPTVWGALAFTADGSHATVSNRPSKAEAEAAVAKKCAAFGRGSCKVLAMPDALCVALATSVGSHSGQRHRVSITGAERTSMEAQKKALAYCNDDPRTRRQCHLMVVVCGDGR
jgi:hypothetical protein